MFLLDSGKKASKKHENVTEKHPKIPDKQKSQSEHNTLNHYTSSNTSLHLQADIQTNGANQDLQGIVTTKSKRSSSIGAILRKSRKGAQPVQDEEIINESKMLTESRNLKRRNSLGTPLVTPKIDRSVLVSAKKQDDVHNLDPLEDPSDTQGGFLDGQLLSRGVTSATNAFTQSIKQELQSQVAQQVTSQATKQIQDQGMKTLVNSAMSGFSLGDTSTEPSEVTSNDITGGSLLGSIVSATNTVISTANNAAKLKLDHDARQLQSKQPPVNPPLSHPERNYQKEDIDETIEEYSRQAGEDVSLSKIKDVYLLNGTNKDLVEAKQNITNEFKAIKLRVTGKDTKPVLKRKEHDVSVPVPESVSTKSSIPESSKSSESEPETLSNLESEAGCQAVNAVFQDYAYQVYDSVRNEDVDKFGSLTERERFLDKVLTINVDEISEGILGSAPRDYDKQLQHLDTREEAIDREIGMLSEKIQLEKQQKLDGIVAEQNDHTRTVECLQHEHIQLLDPHKQMPKHNHDLEETSGGHNVNLLLDQGNHRYIANNHPTSKPDTRIIYGKVQSTLPPKQKSQRVEKLSWDTKPFNQNDPGSYGDVLGTVYANVGTHTSNSKTTNTDLGATHHTTATTSTSSGFALGEMEKVYGDHHQQQQPHLLHNQEPKSLFDELQDIGAEQINSNVPPPEPHRRRSWSSVKQQSMDTQKKNKKRSKSHVPDKLQLQSYMQQQGCLQSDTIVLDQACQPGSVIPGTSVYCPDRLESSDSESESETPKNLIAGTTPVALTREQRKELRREAKQKRREERKSRREERKQKKLEHHDLGHHDLEQVQTERQPRSTSRIRRVFGSIHRSLSRSRKSHDLQAGNQKQRDTSRRRKSVTMDMFFDGSDQSKTLVAGCDDQSDTDNDSDTPIDDDNLTATRGASTLKRKRSFSFSSLFPRKKEAVDDSEDITGNQRERSDRNDDDDEVYQPNLGVSYGSHKLNLEHHTQTNPTSESSESTESTETNDPNGLSGGDPIVVVSEDTVVTMAVIDTDTISNQSISSDESTKPLTLLQNLLSRTYESRYVAPVVLNYPKSGNSSVSDSIMSVPGVFKRKETGSETSGKQKKKSLKSTASVHYIPPVDAIQSDMIVVRGKYELRKTMDEHYLLLQDDTVLCNSSNYDVFTPQQVLQLPPRDYLLTSEFGCNEDTDLIQCSQYPAALTISKKYQESGSTKKKLYDVDAGYSILPLEDIINGSHGQAYEYSTHSLLPRHSHVKLPLLSQQTSEVLLVFVPSYTSEVNPSLSNNTGGDVLPLYGIIVPPSSKQRNSKDPISSDVQQPSLVTSVPDGSGLLADVETHSVPTGVPTGVTPHVSDNKGFFNKLNLLRNQSKKNVSDTVKSKMNVGLSETQGGYTGLMQPGTDVKPHYLICTPESVLNTNAYVIKHTLSEMSVNPLAKDLILYELYPIQSYLGDDKKNPLIHHQPITILFSGKLLLDPTQVLPTSEVQKLDLIPHTCLKALCSNNLPSPYAPPTDPHVPKAGAGSGTSLKHNELLTVIPAKDMTNLIKLLQPILTKQRILHLQKISSKSIATKIYNPVYDMYVI